MSRKLRNAFLAATAAVTLTTGAALAADTPKTQAPATVTTAAPVCKVEDTFDEAAKIKRIYDFELGVVIYKMEGPTPSITAVPMSNIANMPAGAEKLQALQDKLPAGCPKPISNPFGP